MKNLVIAAVLIVLAGQAQARTEVDIQTLVKDIPTVAAGFWPRGFLWNDSLPDRVSHSVKFATRALHPRDSDEKVAKSSSWLECSRSYRWGCKVNPRK